MSVLFESTVSLLEHPDRFGSSGILHLVVYGIDEGRYPFPKSFRLLTW